MNIFNQSLEKIVNDRCSVRSYSNKKVEDNLKKQILKYAETISNPFNIDICYKILDETNIDPNEKLSTYGSIKNAKCYILTKVKKQNFAMHALGYSFEKLVLYITSLGLGSCWLGGTFDKMQFSTYFDLKTDDIFPIISPLGYASENVSLKEKITKKFTDKSNRKPFEQLFYNQNFNQSLNSINAGNYVKALEMVRLAPSALNKQPWCILKDGNVFHFYENKSINNEKKLGYDIQQIDIGIALCHFHLSTIENDLRGHFEKLTSYPKPLKSNTVYQISWICE